MRALVVDDDLTCRLVLEDALSGFAEVDSCADGTDAVRAGRLALALGKPYDLICMDMLMPTMGGLEALRLIRQEEEHRGRPRSSKVIVITGSEDTGTIQEAFGELCDAYLVKPIDTKQFFDVLACVCEVDHPGRG
ncbi:MAG TPA: response regulator [Bryobacteraceae bacterium]|nr:response regulator [Bryobacteraceae bacterium]